MGWASIAATVLSSALGAYGQYASASAAARSAGMEASAAESNARLADINAEMALNEGKEAQAQAAEEAYKAKGRQRAALAEGGLLYSPTGSLLQSETEAEAQREQSRIARQAQMESLNARIQGSNYLTQAASAKSRTSKTSGILGAAGTLLSGVSSTYDTYNKYYGGGS